MGETACRLSEEPRCPPLLADEPLLDAGGEDEAAEDPRPLPRKGSDDGAAVGWAVAASAGSAAATDRALAKAELCLVVKRGVRAARAAMPARGAGAAAGGCWEDEADEDEDGSCGCGARGEASATGGRDWWAAGRAGAAAGLAWESVAGSATGGWSPAWTVGGLNGAWT